MRKVFVVVALLAGAILAGCGAAGTDSTGDFKGEDKLVAQVVEDLEKATSDEDYKRVCDDLVTRGVAQQLAASIRSKKCTEAVEQVLDDSDNNLLTVKKVAINGTNATAAVEQSDGGKREQVPVQLQKDGRTWRISSIGPATAPSAASPTATPTP